MIYVTAARCKWGAIVKLKEEILNWGYFAKILFIHINLNILTFPVEYQFDEIEYNKLMRV